MESNVLYKIDIVGKFIQVRGAMTKKASLQRDNRSYNSKESLILAQDER